MGGRRSTHSQHCVNTIQHPTSSLTTPCQYNTTPHFLTHNTVSIQYNTPLPHSQHRVNTIQHPTSSLTTPCQYNTTPHFLTHNTVSIQYNTPLPHSQHRVNTTPHFLTHNTVSIQHPTSSLTTLSYLQGNPPPPPPPRFNVLQDSMYYWTGYIFNQVLENNPQTPCC